MNTPKKKKFIFHLDVKSTFKNIKKVENAHSIVAIEIKRVIKYKYNYSLNKCNRLLILWYLYQWHS